MHGFESPSIRVFYRDCFNIRVLFGSVTGVNTEKREVLIGSKRVPYDFLVLATGAQYNYFERDEWEPDAPGLKRMTRPKYAAGC